MGSKAYFLWLVLDEELHIQNVLVGFLLRWGKPYFHIDFLGRSFRIEVSDGSDCFVGVLGDVIYYSIVVVGLNLQDRNMHHIYFFIVQGVVDVAFYYPDVGARYG